MDDVVQFASLLLRVFGTGALLVLAVAFRRWTILALAAFLALHTGIYVALLAGVGLSNAVVTYGGVLSTGIVICCVGAVLASRAERERILAILVRAGGHDDEAGRWQA